MSNFEQYSVVDSPGFSLPSLGISSLDNASLRRGLFFGCLVYPLRVPMGGAMVRFSIAATLILLSASASAQHIDMVKGIKFGVGCVGPVTTFAPRLGSCALESSKARIWCPNGEIFDRHGEPPQSYVARSICNLNQVL